MSIFSVRLLVYWYVSPVKENTKNILKYHPSDTRFRGISEFLVARIPLA